MVPTEHLLVFAKRETGKVEKGQRIAVANVEEEMGRTFVVAIFEEFVERKP